jgi:hypothetical protein
MDRLSLVPTVALAKKMPKAVVQEILVLEETRKIVFGGGMGANCPHFGPQLFSTS